MLYRPVDVAASGDARIFVGVRKGGGNGGLGRGVKDVLCSFLFGEMMQL